MYNISPLYTPTADAGLFVNDDDVDKNATAEIFMLVAGVSTITFGLATDLPFLVAPSILYVARAPGCACDLLLRKSSQLFERQDSLHFACLSVGTVQ